MPDHPLLQRLPESRDCSPDELLDRFLDYAAEKRLRLYPAQEEAILELLAEWNVILNTPTGSGKSLVAAQSFASHSPDSSSTSRKARRSSQLKSRSHAVVRPSAVRPAIRLPSIPKL
jgi:hypothetical protein